MKNCWANGKANLHQTIYYDVTKVDDKTYRFEKKSISAGDVTVYNGFLSEINGTRFMNIYEEGSEFRTYYFYKVEVTTSGAKSTLSPVTENITEKFATSAELKDFFKKNMVNSYFFDKDQDVYIKAD